MRDQPFDPDYPGLLPPHTRIAIPKDSSQYNVLDVEESSFDDFSPRVVDALSDILVDNGVDVPHVALREVVDNLVHAVPCSASIVLDPSFRTRTDAGRN